MRVFGKSTQDDIPSPTNPIPIANIGDKGNINVSVDNQKLILSTQDGFKGLKADAGYTYKDEKGQGWICDEIDLDRGKYIQRVVKGVFDGNLSNYGFLNNNNIWHFGKACLTDVFNGKLIRNNIGREACALCDKFPTQVSSYNTTIDAMYVSRDGTSMTLKTEVFGQNVNPDVVKAYFAKNPMTVYCLSKEPIEYDLSSLEIEAFRKLYMNYPTTTISNDENCDMELEYTVDTKSYVDKKIAEISGAVIAQKGA